MLFTQKYFNIKSPRVHRKNNNLPFKQSQQKKSNNIGIYVKLEKCLLSYIL